MYYSAWTKEIAGGIFTATSIDGLDWTKKERPCLDLGASFDCNMVSEPCVTELPDGRARLFYEARDKEGYCRISPPPHPPNIRAVSANCASL